MKKFYILLLLCSLMLPLLSLIRTVKQDGTGNYTQIQTAILASVTGDTVLVYPGRYFENINFSGKRITVASLYIFNPSDSLISSTIIDGNHQGSVVSFVNNETSQSVIDGFTIENGTGTLWGYSTGGGGIRIITAHPTIKNCHIQNNFAYTGGGIAAVSYPATNTPYYISNCKIRYNTAYWAGGISSYDKVVFDTLNLSDIYDNYAGIGNDFFSTNEAINQSIIVDTFTVAENNKHNIWCFSNFTFSAEHGKINHLNQDLYIAPDGNDSYSGTSPGQPLKTINYALNLVEASAENPLTIHLAPGTYSRSLNQQIFPLNLKKFVSIEGSGRDITILDAEMQNGLIAQYEPDQNITVSKMTLKNCNSIIEHNGDICGYAINMYHPTKLELSELTLDNCLQGSILKIAMSGQPVPDSMSIKINNVIIKNSRYFGIALDMVRDAEIKNVSIFNNTGFPQPNGGGGVPVGLQGYTLIPWIPEYRFSNILLYNNSNSIEDWPWLKCSSGFLFSQRMNATITNATIIDNTSTPNGGPILLYSTQDSNINFYNSVIWGNHPNSIWLGPDSSTSHPSYLSFNNCLVQGGENAVHDTGLLNTAYFLDWGAGNLNTDPLFADSTLGMYNISSASPCRDAGTTDIPDFVFPETDLLGNPRISGNTIDIGAYEFQSVETDFSAEPRNGDEPLTVQFTNLCGPEAIQFNWDFNSDGTIDSNEPNPQYIYTEPGRYSVTLQVNGDAGYCFKSEYIVVDSLGTNDINELEVTSLSEAFPNPFQAKTSFLVKQADPGKIKVDIYNIKGQKVKTLMDAWSAGGKSQLIWDGTNNQSKRVSSGIYSAIMTLNKKQIAIRKVTILK